MASQEMQDLKSKADLMGITYPGNVSKTKLREKINAKMNEGNPDAVVVSESAHAAPDKVVESKLQRQNRLRKEARMLQRISVTCLNPDRRDHPGEILTVSNSAIGTVSKFIPFDGRAWHTPQAIINLLEERKCQVFAKPTKKNPSSVGSLIFEFNVKYLDPLNEQEMAELADIQKLDGV